MLEGPLCVVDTVTSAGTAILYSTPAKRAGRVTFVQNVPEHFVRLDGPDTTVDQLLATAPIGPWNEMSTPTQVSSS